MLAYYIRSASLLALVTLAGCATIPLESSGFNVSESTTKGGGSGSETDSAAAYCFVASSSQPASLSFAEEVAGRATTGLPESLYNDPVASNIAKMIGYAAVKGHHAGRRLIASATEPDQADPEVSPAQESARASYEKALEILRPADIGPLALKSFGARLHNLFVHPAARLASASSNDDLFWKQLLLYYMQYYDGTFVDRLGNQITKPGSGSASSGTQGISVSDSDISGAVSVFVEFLSDWIVKTPVWTSATGDTQSNDTTTTPAGTQGSTTQTIYYYPAGTNSEPTVASSGLIQPIPLVDDNLPDGTSAAGMLGITKTKARVIRYVSNAAASEASILGGTVGGSFGGFGVSLGAFGKISIGDNQTLQTIIKAALSHAFARAAEQASCEILARLPEPSDDIAQDIESLGLTMPTDPKKAANLKHTIKASKLTERLLLQTKTPRLQ